MEPINFYAGIFVFNPLDDESHLERIEKNITSICIARDASPLMIFVDVLLNKSTTQTGEPGVGLKTQELVSNLQDKYGFQVRDFRGENSCSKGYRDLLEFGHVNIQAEKLVVFADDYIIPSFWFDTMQEAYERVKDAGFITPATCNVSQKNLVNSFQPHPSWDIKVSRKGDHNRWNYETTYKGVEIQHIEDLAKTFLSLDIVDFVPPPSFETTVFTRELIEKVGFFPEGYYSIFYDNDYFRIIQSKGIKGYIAKNCFAFHYGKGGTKAFYKETADEKFIGSPVEHQLQADIALWNARWGESVSPWWGSPD